MNKKIIIISVLLLFVLILYNLYYSNISFNSHQWKIKQEMRDRMVDDILTNCLFVGKSKIEIKELLGTDCFKCNNDSVFDKAQDVGYITKKIPRGYNNVTFNLLYLNFRNERVESLTYYKSEDVKGRICDQTSSVKSDMSPQR